MWGNQSVSFPHASLWCQLHLENNKGKWYIPVHQEVSPFTVAIMTCKLNVKRKVIKQYKEHRIIHSMKPVLGNVFGGGIGAGVDMASGAAYDYPVDIRVPMERA